MLSPTTWSRNILKRLLRLFEQSSRVLVARGLLCRNDTHAPTSFATISFLLLRRNRSHNRSHIHSLCCNLHRSVLQQYSLIFYVYAYRLKRLTNVYLNNRRE